MMDTGTLRVFIADDHPVVIAGLRSLLAADPGMEIIGEACDGRTAINLATQLQPDVAVLDMSMPDKNGAEVAQTLRDVCPECRVLILTGHDDRAYVQGILKAGIAGYMLKQCTPAELIRAIRVIAAGGWYLDPAIAASVMGGASSRTLENFNGRVPDLSEREVEVLRLVAMGYSNKEVSRQLELSVKTVETYKHRAMEKLGFRTRVEVVRYGMSRGWLLP